MPLSSEQMEKAQQFFRLNGVVADCPYCGTSGWEAQEIVSATVVDEQGTPRPESKTAPMVQFVCINCAHVTLFDATRLGLVNT
jgi:hypothetical protein